MIEIDEVIIVNVGWKEGSRWWGRSAEGVAVERERLFSFRLRVWARSEEKEALASGSSSLSTAAAESNCCESRTPKEKTGCGFWKKQRSQQTSTAAFQVRAVVGWRFRQWWWIQKVVNSFLTISYPFKMVVVKVFMTETVFDNLQSEHSSRRSFC